MQFGHPLKMLGLSLVAMTAFGGRAAAQYGARWGWGYPYPEPTCYSCGVIIGPDNPLRQHDNQPNDQPRANATLEDPNHLNDAAAVNRLIGAGAELVFRVDYSCASFYGQTWFNDPRRVYADFGPDNAPGGGNDAIWTCALDDGNVLYKASCQSGRARADGQGCER